MLKHDATSAAVITILDLRDYGNILCELRYNNAAFMPFVIMDVCTPIGMSCTLRSAVKTTTMFLLTLA